MNIVSSPPLKGTDDKRKIRNRFLCLSLMQLILILMQFLRLVFQNPSTFFRSFAELGMLTKLVSPFSLKMVERADICALYVVAGMLPEHCVSISFLPVGSLYARPVFA